jgi:hypothetical protein
MIPIGPATGSIASGPVADLMIGDTEQDAQISSPVPKPLTDSTV